MCPNHKRWLSVPLLGPVLPNFGTLALKHSVAAKGLTDWERKMGRQTRVGRQRKRGELVETGK